MKSPRSLDTCRPAVTAFLTYEQTKLARYSLLVLFLCHLEATFRAGIVGASSLRTIGATRVPRSSMARGIL